MRNILPEKWYIIRNSTSREPINNWFNKGIGTNNYCGQGIICFPNCESGVGFMSGRHSYSNTRELLEKGYEEIIFEEFKLLVLNEQPPVTEPLIFN
jgi:hypothetical protein